MNEDDYIFLVFKIKEAFKELDYRIAKRNMSELPTQTGRDSIVFTKFANWLLKALRKGFGYYYKPHDDGLDDSVIGGSPF